MRLHYLIDNALYRPLKVATIDAIGMRKPTSAKFKRLTSTSRGPWTMGIKASDRQWSHTNPQFPPDRSSQRYRYLPLDSSKNEIRLLRVLYATYSDEPIKCILFHTTLDDAPPYEALSYAWGDRSTSFPVKINTGEVAVTHNLKLALQRLRPSISTLEFVVWIDALCINQQDIQERNFQTGKMREIYQNAKKVIVWIGPEGNGSVHAIQLARQLNACPKQDVEKLFMEPVGKALYDRLESLILLFRRRYWWRIWVIQEVSMSRETLIFCGQECIPWAELENVCDLMRGVEDLLKTKIFYKSQSKVRTLTHGGPRGLQLSRYSPGATTPPLLDLLLSHKSKKSTDPRDKVYALVGISSSRNSFGPIDYSSPVCEVFCHTARHIISTHKRLDIICVKQHNLDQYGLPSWVPDWTRPQYGHGLVGLHHHVPKFSAAGSSLASTSILNGRILEARGFVISRIKSTSTIFKRKGAPSDVLPPLQVFIEWRNLFFKHNPDSPAAVTEFGKTITCGEWDFEDHSEYQRKLAAISSLSTSLTVLHADLAVLESERVDQEDTTIVMDQTTELEKEATAALLSVSLMMNRRRFFLSENNWSGLGPWDALEGDAICILFGCRFPLILRKIEDHYILIGEAYVHGYMHGKAMVEFGAGMFKLQTFKIH